MKHFLFAPAEPDMRPRIKVRDYLEIIVDDGSLSIVEGFDDIEIRREDYAAFLEALHELAVELGWIDAGRPT